MKKKSIFKQLLFPMITIVCALAISLLGITILVFMNSYQKELMSESQDRTTLMSGQVGTFMDGAYGISEELATNPSMLTMDTAIQTPILEDCVARNEYMELLYVQKMDGMQTGRSSGELADRSTRWWFLQMMEQKQPFISKSYYSVSTGMPCASIFFPMNRDGEMVGVFAVDIKLDYMQSFIEEFSTLEEERYSYIIDGEGVVVAHPDSQQIEEQYNYKTLTKTVAKKDENGNTAKDENGNILTEESEFAISDAYKEVITKVMQGAEGCEQISNQGKNYIISYTPVAMKGESESWSVITIQEKSKALTMLWNILMTSILISILAIVVASFIIVVIARKITLPIMHITSSIQEASEGDFTVLADTSSKNEIGVLAKSFNNMTSKISGILYRITYFSEEVIQSSGKLKEIQENTKEIVENIQNISEGNNKQTENAKKVVIKMEEMQSKFDDLSDMSNHMLTEAKDTIESGVEGTQSIQELLAQNQQTAEMVSLSYEKIMALNERSQKIQGIVDTITEISTETSLLSLNASIEAARAGEQGKGFAVVAESIGKLATESTEATSNIHNIIEELCDEINNTVDTFSEIQKVFETQTTSVSKVQGSFENLKGLAGQTQGSVEKMHTVIDEMHKLNRSTVHAAEKIRDIAQSNEEVSNGMVGKLTMQLSNIDAVAESVESLSKGSHEMTQEMTKFKLQGKAEI